MVGRDKNAMRRDTNMISNRYVTIPLIRRAVTNNNRVSLNGTIFAKRDIPLNNRARGNKTMIPETDRSGTRMNSGFRADRAVNWDDFIMFLFLAT